MFLLYWKSDTNEKYVWSKCGHALGLNKWEHFYVDTLKNSSLNDDSSILASGVSTKMQQIPISNFVIPIYIYIYDYLLFQTYNSLIPPKEFVKYVSIKSPWQQNCFPSSNS